MPFHFKQTSFGLIFLELVARMDKFNQQFGKAMQICKNSEGSLVQAIKAWENFITYQKSVESWLKEAKSHLQNNNFPTIESVEAENRFFEVTKFVFNELIS